MMHCKDTGFIIAILSNGKVLREVNGKVFIPFDSEYSIKIKNPTLNRVGVSIDIDGTSITSQKIIIDKLSDITLNRMCIDGDLNSGSALKFVSVKHKDVQDPSSHENGQIKVSFFKEVVRFGNSVITTNHIHHHHHIDYPFWYNSNTTYGNGAGDVVGINNIVEDCHNLNFTSSTGPSASYSTNNLRTKSCNQGTLRRVQASVDTLGATVPGNQTTQQFTTVDIELESTPCSVMVLTLRGRKNEPLYTHDVLYCTKCGNKVKKNDNFCRRCGTKIMYCNTL